MSMGANLIVVPTPQITFDSATDNSRRASNPFFLGANNQLADKGFIVTSTDELIRWARTGSLRLMSFGLACCAVEMMQFCTPRYDFDRLGMALRGSPRQSDPELADTKHRVACAAPKDVVDWRCGLPGEPTGIACRPVNDLGTP
jgi:hypothetical protein